MPGVVRLPIMTKVPVTELNDRMQRFRACMDAENPNWELAAIFGRINQYYFTGTMQDGVLLIPRSRPGRVLRTPKLSSGPARSRSFRTSGP